MANAIVLIAGIVLTYVLGYGAGRRRGYLEGFRRGVARPTPEAKET
jgi:hypothetical protein